MPCGLFLFDCYPILLLLVNLLEPVHSRSFSLPTSSVEKLTSKERRNSIFDDKHGASLGELVRTKKGTKDGTVRLISA